MQGHSTDGITAQTTAKLTGESPYSRQSTISSHIQNTTSAPVDDFPVPTHFLDEEDGEEIVAKTIQQLVDSAFMKVCASELQSRLIPFIVLKAKAELLELLRVSILKKDTEYMAFTHECWMEDKEQSTVTPDAHSRGLIPVVSRPNSAAQSVTSSPIPSNGDPDMKELTSSGRKASVMGGGRKMSSMRMLDIVEDIGANSNNTDVKHTLMPIPEPRRLLSRADSDVSRTKHAQKIKEKAESEKKAAEQLKQRMEQMEKEEKIMRDRLSRELKGKQYTYDTDGSVIVVNPVNPEKLPATSIHVKVHIKSGDQSTDQNASKYQKRESQGAKQKSGAGVLPTHNDDTNGKSPAKPKKVVPTVDEFTFKEAIPQPITNVDNIKIAPGVVIREGSRFRAAEKSIGDTTRWSKKDYEAAILSNRFPESPTKLSMTLESPAPPGLPSRETSELNGFKDSKLATKQKEIVSQAKMASAHASSKERADSERFDRMFLETKTGA